MEEKKRQPPAAISQREPRPDDWLSIEDCAAELNCGHKSVRRVMGLTGEPCLLPHFLHLNKYYVRRDALQAYRIRVEMQGAMQSPSGGYRRQGA